MQQTPKQIKAEQRSMMWAMILIIAILFGFQYFQKPLPKATEPVEEEKQGEALVVQEVVQKNIVFNAKHVSVDNDSVRGQISLNGGVFDELVLKNISNQLPKIVRK